MISGHVHLLSILSWGILVYQTSMSFLLHFILQHGFIYSAKMLQNYQQGLGIFLTYKKTMEASNEKAIIRFKTDPNNDHDAMNQLSTGQLAVVSLAFTLSLNTMFKLSDNLKFLMIDDPIQDMDAMNVLSFIEILRHGIIDRYQIILFWTKV